MHRIPKSVFFLGVVSFFNDVAAEMIYPIVPIFLTTVLGAPVAIMGLIEGIAEGTASIAKFVFGYLSDRVGKRKIFVVSGYSFSAISKLLVGLATTWPLVLFARFIDRLGKGVRTSARDAILLQNTNQTNKGFIFGFHRAFDSAGAVVGPLLALFLLSVAKKNIRAVFFIAFIPSVIAVAMLILFVKEKNRTGNSKGGDLTPSAPLLLGEGKGEVHKWQDRLLSSWKSLNPSLKLFFIISIIFSLGNSSDAFLILRSKELGLTTTLTVFTYMLYNLSQTIFAAPAGQLADKIGARRVFAYGLLVFTVVYFLFGTINSPGWVWFLFPIYGLYIAATDGVSKAYISEFITEKVSGTYFGLYQTGIAIASFFASLIAGILWNSFSPSVAFYYGAIMSLLAFLLLFYGKFIRRL